MRLPRRKDHDAITWYDTPAATASNPFPTLVEFDTFTATRTRSDRFGFLRRHSK